MNFEEDILLIFKIIGRVLKMQRQKKDCPFRQPLEYLYLHVNGPNGIPIWGTLNFHPCVSLGCRNPS
jgi:hypothetical protein